MWYSATKIGIHAIDMEHANIDFMLNIIISGEGDDALLEGLIAAMGNHFEHEKALIEGLGKCFPDDHDREHGRLLSILQGKKLEWQKGELSGIDFAQYIKQTLLLHVDKFDKELSTLATSSS